MTLTDSLAHHAFVRRAMREAVEVNQRLIPNPWRLDADYVRDPDEHEYYVIAVGHALAHLLACFQQMEQAVGFISDFSYSKRMRERGIRRHQHLLYNVENYIIRTQALYDRLLQLVDRVFHLLNEPRNCSHRVIAGNRKVARTNIPSLLGTIRTLLRRYQEHRHTIIHRETYKEDTLRRIEGLYLVDDLEDSDDDKLIISRTYALRHARAQFLKKTIAEKRDEFTAFNDQILKALMPLLTALESIYDQERERLTRMVGPISA